MASAAGSGDSRETAWPGPPARALLPVAEVLQADTVGPRGDIKLGDSAAVGAEVGRQPGLRDGVGRGSAMNLFIFPAWRSDQRTVVNPTKFHTSHV